jgi:hypothetical protein
MAKTQFDIRFLLIATAVIACVMTFGTQVAQTGNWLVALMITLLLANVLAVIIAMFIYVIAPMIK